MYFYLNPEYYLIVGKKKGAIYDLIKGNIYSIDVAKAKILALSELGYPISQIVEKTNLSEETIINDLDYFSKHGVGNFYDKPTFVQKLRYGSQTYPKPGLSKPILSKAFLELNNNCQQACYFCESKYRSLGCMGCTKWNYDDQDELTENQWKNVVFNLVELGYQYIYVGVGDLFLKWSKIRSLLEYANTMTKLIFVKFPFGSLNQEIVSIINELKVNPIVQFPIDGSRDLLDQQFECLKLMKEPLTSLIISKPNREDEITNLFNKLISINSDNSIKVDIIGDSLDEFVSEPLVSSSRKLPKVFTDTFFNNVSYNSCLSGSICVSPGGDILPCPMFKKQILGNIKHDSFSKIIRSKEIYLSETYEREYKNLDDFWSLTKDLVEKCNACEFRYACFDCSYVQYTATNNYTSMATCKYNPYEGNWGK